MRIIYSWHDRDPEEATGLAYHGRSQRGSKSLSLVNFVEEDVMTLPPDAFYVDLHFDKVTSQLYIYRCKYLVLKIIAISLPFDIFYNFSIYVIHKKDVLSCLESWPE